MGITQTEVLKRLKEPGIGMIPINDSLSDDEYSVLNKLETFVIRKEKGPYKPNSRFYESNPALYS